jgi:photosystem II stability/assembly factor-like uncharacterized protein
LGIKKENKKKLKIKIISLLITLVCIFYFQASSVNAHSPHDVIDALAVSPDYSQDRTVFIIIKNTWVLKSVNGGYSWKYLFNGLDRQFLLSSISISPSFQMDRTLFISSKGNGIYRSTNGGDSWEKQNEGLPGLNINFVSISPRYSLNGVVYAAGTEGGLFTYSKGRGKWQKAINDDKKITSIGYILNNDSLIVIVGDNNGYLYSLDPNGDQKILCKIRNSGSITSIAIPSHQKFNDIFYVGTEKGVYGINNGGKSFSKIENMLSETYINAINFSPKMDTEEPMNFVSTWNDAIFKYSNKSMNWEKIGVGLTTDRQADSDEYKSPHFRNIEFSNNFKNDKTMFLAGFDGLFKSYDAGKNWIQLETLPVNVIKGFSISPTYNNKYSIAVTTYGGGAYISWDSGVTWSVQNMGLRTTRLSDIIFSPNYSDDKEIFTASAHYFYLFNHDKNKWDAIYLKDASWQSRIYRILVKLGISHVWLEEKIFQKTNVSRIWPNIIAISPNFKKDKTLFFGSRYRGFFRSVNGGEKFTNIWSDINDINKKKITSLTISPNFKSDRTLFAGVRWDGIYKSVDIGKTWIRKNEGIRFLEKAESIIPPYYVLAISPNYHNDQTVFLGTETGLYKSINGGTSWKEIRIATNETNSCIYSVAISPNYKNDKTVIVSVYGKGLFKSETGGSTWKTIAKQLIKDNHLLEFIIFSPSYDDDSTIWGASREANFKSEDRGNTWMINVVPIVRYENNRDAINYVGNWKTVKSEKYSARSISYSENYEASANLTFIGTGVRWIGTKSDNLGIAKIYIDNQFKGDIDQFDLQRKNTVNLFEINNLTFGPHTITVKAVNKKNKKSKGTRIEIDCFDVILNKNAILSKN